MKIYRGSMVVLKGVKRHGFYYLIEETLTGNTAITTTLEDQKIVIWHKRLGHINDKGLQIKYK